MKYTVTFTQYYEFEVEAKTVEEAEEKGEERFRDLMLRPIARTDYDDYEVFPDYDDDSYEDEQENEV